METRSFVVEEKHFENVTRYEDALMILDKYLKKQGRIFEDTAEELEAILEEIDYQISCLEEMVYGETDEEYYF